MWSPVPRNNKEIKRLGLIVNPLAGIGGRVGLKGSDGYEIQQQALELGAVPQAGKRSQQCLQVLGEMLSELEILSPPCEMGEDAARGAGYAPHVVGEISPGGTTPKDTVLAAQVMMESQVDVLLFAGGDGTARDIYRAVGNQLPVIGIPAGVKIHSAVFATHPHAAGELTARFLQNRTMKVQEAEVVDVDEEAYRDGIITTRLYGYLMVPYHRHLVQSRKAPTPAVEAVQMDEIARDVIENMQTECLYILGPGTTTRAVANRLGVEKTLVGVDVITREGVIALDANERQLLNLIPDQVVKIIVTPIGGQGFLFGRGNQPISPEVIMRVGRENIHVICTPDKLHSFSGRPLLVDTGDAKVDELLNGHVTITTGYHERAVYRIGI
jgi:predicted polyphosphate/ATP-dependent NAD kinase